MIHWLWLLPAFIFGMIVGSLAVYRLFDWIAQLLWLWELD